MSGSAVRVPVLNENGQRLLQNVLWSAERERTAGSPPSFFMLASNAQRPGEDYPGYYLFYHPGPYVVDSRGIPDWTEVEGRRYRFYRSKLPPVWDDPGMSAIAGSPAIGISLFHTVGDRDRAVEQMNTDMKSIVSELIAKTGADPHAFVFDVSAASRDPVGYLKRTQEALAILKKSPLYPLWRDVVSPLYSEWNSFYHNQSSWQEWLTNWEEYEHWFDRVKGLRDTVEAEIGPLRSPRLVKLSETLPAAAVRKVGEGAGDVFQILKYGLYGVLAIGGVIALSSVVQNLRKGEDPAAKYLALARRQ